MMKAIHPYFCADTSTDKGEEEEGGLGNTPFAMDGPVFVDTVDNQGQNVDNNKINKSDCGYFQK